MGDSDPSYLVQDIIQENPSVRSYTFAHGMSVFNFEPGQFVIATLLGTAAPQGALTLTSSPLNQEEFTVTVKRIGTFGTAFYDSIVVGSMVTLRKPAGGFRLNSDPTRPVCFIGRDYAITAARSFYNFLVDTNSSRSFILIHELSSPEEAIFKKEFTSGRLKLFQHFQVNLPPTGIPKNIREGRVNVQSIVQYVPNFQQTLFYLAGEGEDVQYYRSQLEALRVPSAHVLHERWS